MIDLLALEGSLVVSCQAPAGSPLRHPDHMAAIAEAAQVGGAAAIRANGAADISAIRERTSIPVIGLNKRQAPDGTPWITPSMEDVHRVIEAGADVVAIDATLRHRQFGSPPDELIGRIHDTFGIPVLADVDSQEAARAAAFAGADAVATTLAGYTGPEAEDSSHIGPDIELVKRVSAANLVPVFAEGRYRCPKDVQAAFAAGAFAVVVGTAITDPIALTRRFIADVPDKANRSQPESSLAPRP